MTDKDQPVLHISSKEAEEMLWHFCMNVCKNVCKNGGLVVVHGDVLSWEPRRA